MSTNIVTQAEQIARSAVDPVKLLDEIVGLASDLRITLAHLRAARPDRPLESAIIHGLFDEQAIGLAGALALTFEDLAQVCPDLFPERSQP